MPGRLIGLRTGLLSARTAARLGVAEGDWLALDTGGRVDSVRVAGLLAPADEPSRLALENLLLVDVGTAQDLLGRGGLDRVDLILEDHSTSAEGAGRANLERRLPGGAVLQEAGESARTLREMTRAFDLNLRALSLLALIFGVFLIYNSVTFSVVQRRRLLGILRALGATRRQIFGIVQLEALLMGVAGAAIGIILGIALGSGLVRLVTRTIQDLYFVVTVRELILTPASLARGAALGVLGTLVAALLPAWEAATTRPSSALVRSELEAGVRRRLPLISLVGLLLVAAGGLGLAVSDSVTGSFAGLFGVILGAALLTPAATVFLMRLLRPAAGAVFGVLGRMAATGVTAGLSRTGPAIAALTIAVSVSIGVGVMVESFRGSLETWLGRTLSADLYISPARTGGGARAVMDPAAVALVERDTAVAEVRRYRRVQVPTADGTIDLLAIGIDSRLRSQFEFLEGDPAGFWADFVAGRALVVSEPFAYHNDVAIGDPITVRTGRGTTRIPVAGVVRDYGSDRGTVMISYAGYRRLWDDPAVSSLAVNLRRGAEADGAVERMRRATAATQALNVRPNVRLRESSLEVFDRTFAITRVLRLLALVVAFVAVLSALMALQLERERELGLLRATGLTPGQVWGMVGSQTGLLGLVAGLLAVPLGLLVAVLMIEFVNRRSFGWSMDFDPSPELLVQGVVLALASALLAGLYPSWRMARTSPAEAMRGE